MNNPEKYVPPEDGKNLFDLMRRAALGEIEVEEVVDETGPIGSKIIKKSETAEFRPKKPQTGAGAMADWQRSQEDEEDRRFEQRNKAA